MSTQIKKITKFDSKLIHHLFHEIEEEQALPNPQFFKEEQNILLVAYTDNRPCGFLYGYLLQDPKSENPKIFLYSVDVFKQYQKMGIGTDLINELKNIARANHCSEIFVLTNKSNEAAMKLYEKTGGQKEKDDDVLFIYKTA